MPGIRAGGLCGTPCGPNPQGVYSIALLRKLWRPPASCFVSCISLFWGPRFCPNENRHPIKTDGAADVIQAIEIELADLIGPPHNRLQFPADCFSELLEVHAPAGRLLSDSRRHLFVG